MEETRNGVSACFPRSTVRPWMESLLHAHKGTCTRRSSAFGVSAHGTASFGAASSPLGVTRIASRCLEAEDQTIGNSLGVGLKREAGVGDLDRVEVPREVIGELHRTCHRARHPLLHLLRFGDHKLFTRQVEPSVLAAAEGHRHRGLLPRVEVLIDHHDAELLCPCPVFVVVERRQEGNVRGGVCLSLGEALPHNPRANLKLRVRAPPPWRARKPRRLCGTGRDREASTTPPQSAAEGAPPHCAHWRGH
mmetsp:Transcript_6042/g.15391  ORF Transcript_6042/g.15391 Transcript_6042/m.15391 type:complete len:249 (+) Transcript_6042:232-978(+)